MNLWIVALLIQAGISVVAAEMGHAATALPRRLAYLAAVLSMSVPIGKATAGGAGLLYAFDLLGPVCLLLGFSRFGAVWRDAACRRFFLTAALLLVGWPLTTTLFGILRTGIMDPKFIGLALMRGLAYLGVFLLLLSVGRTRSALSGMFMVGGIAIALICLCGVLQFQLQIDLDLYDVIGEPVAGNLSGNFGAGFMGLYRGAVGAWGAVSLTVLPVVFLPRRRWWMLSLPLAVLLLAGILISGSRQGILFGVLGLTAALLAVPWLPPAGRRAGMAVKAALLLSMLVVFGALTLQTLSRSAFGYFLIQRYMDSLRHPVAQAAEARNQLPGVIEQVLAHPDVLLVGTGIQAPAATPAPPGWPYRFVYLDSEIGWVLQQNGLPALLVYGLFVLATLVFLGVALPWAEADDRLVLAGVLLMTGVGILFSYGHFFLLHVHSSNAPIAAWLWAALGLGIGTAARTQAAGSAARTEAGERLINAMDRSEAHGSLVSILIITWNRRQALCRSLDSALAQTYAPLEIVLVDNAGTDGSAEMVAERYPQVRLLQTHRNLGCPSARNLGVANCRGSLIYMLDDDGWLHEDAVARAVARAREDETIAAVLSSLFIVAEERIVTRLPADQQESGYRGSFAGGGVLLRRQAFLDAGGYPDDFFRQAEEDDLALRWLDRGFVCFHEPSSIMYHEPSPVRANNHLIAFYSLRNTNKTGLRHWPFPWCALRPMVNLGYALWALVRYGDVAMPAQVLGSLLLDLCTLRGNRRPVSRKAFRLYRQLCRHYRTVHPLRDAAAVPQTSPRG